MLFASPLLLATSLALPFAPSGGEGGAGPAPAVSDSLAWIQARDSLAGLFTFEHGTVQLANGVATISLPPGFKFLDKEQSEKVLTGLWGNPQQDGVMGMILPEGDNVLSDSSYAFVIQYDEMGYVKDDDADAMDYDKLLSDMKADEVQDNQDRVAKGYEPAYLIGWATKPFYDKERKVLHWAKEIKFGDSTAVSTLNYNVRVLGRKGVLVLNAVAGMHELPMVQQHIPEVLGMVHFNEGFKYEQFDSKVDDVAAWTIGGLVAGKVLAKVGLFALLAKSGKAIFLVIAGAGGAIWRFITGRRKKEQPPQPPATIS